MAWLHFQISTNNRGHNPPAGWTNLVTLLSPLIDTDNLQKIELVAFPAKGSRTLRWLLQTTDPEYCTEDEAVSVARKLAFLMLNSQNGIGITPNLEGEFPEAQFKREVTICPLCKRIIDVSDFDRDGRVDLESIQIGHDIPLSRALNSHNANNVFWIHRRCNYIKGEQTIKESLISLINIVRNHVI